LVLLGLAEAEVRTWTHRTGRARVEGELVDFNNGKVWIKPLDGPKFGVLLSDLAKADQDFVQTTWSQRKVLAKHQADADPDTIPYAPGRQLCTLASRALDETSGMAASRRNPGLFWAHNDSGDEARLYLFDRKGRDLGSCLLRGIQAFDWEDIASFSWQGKSYLLVADTGNDGMNAAVHMLHWLEEPPADPQQGVFVKDVPVLATIHFSFEDDFRDCEALAVDPTDRSILLVSKDRGLGGHVYLLPWPSTIDARKAYSARLIATLRLPPATGLDIAPDGRRAVLVTYGNAYEFRRGAGENWAATFAQPPREIPLPERKQGESICYGPDGKTLYLTSEQLPTPLWEVPVR